VQSKDLDALPQSFDVIAALTEILGIRQAIAEYGLPPLLN
jgi:hypothetical protein